MALLHTCRQNLRRDPNVHLRRSWGGGTLLDGTPLHLLSAIFSRRAAAFDAGETRFQPGHAHQPSSPMVAPGSSRTIAVPVAAVVAPAISSFFASQLSHASGLRRLGGGGVFRRRRTLASAQLRMFVGRHPGGSPRRHERFGPEGARRLEPSGRCGQADRDLVMTRPGSINRESRRRPLTHNREARHPQCLDQRIGEPERIVCEIAVWWRRRSACCLVEPVV
jgi:hypothetical protein